MRLNMDCIRDILLTVEELSGFRSLIHFPDVKPQADHLRAYSDEELLYHVRQCEQSGLLFGVKYFGNSIIVQDLLPAGHSFLSNIRPVSTWQKVKEIASDVGATALDITVDIASRVASDLIKSQFLGHN